jgi:hypothetical protein
LRDEIEESPIEFMIHRCTEVEIRRTLRDEIEESPIEFMKLPNTECVLWGDAYKFNQKTFLNWERRTRIFNVFSFLNAFSGEGMCTHGTTYSIPLLALQ